MKKMLLKMSAARMNSMLFMLHPSALIPHPLFQWLAFGVA
jgi:hypothetical protein